MVVVIIGDNIVALPAISLHMAGSGKEEAPRYISENEE